MKKTSILFSKVAAALVCLVMFNPFSSKSQNGPVCDTYTNVVATLSTGLGSNNVLGVYVSGSTIYAATGGGLSISTDGGATFTNKSSNNGLGNTVINGVYASGSTVYAATSGGLSITTDGGASFTNKNTTNGLGNNFVKGVYVSGSTVYAATGGGLSISTDGGASYTNKTTTNGLGSNNVLGVYASGSTVYAATGGGLSISTDGGASFTNKTTTNGLGNNAVRGVYASGSTVYAATNGGLSISTDDGANFTNKTTTNGLGGNIIYGVYASGSTVYAATSGGLSISTDGGASFTNKTTTNGLGNSVVNGVYASGSTVYAATTGGFSISTDGGASFTNTATTIPSGSGLGNNNVFGVYASGSTVYTATQGGFSISTDGGASFTNKTTTNGLGDNYVNGVYVSGSTVYAATQVGLSISTDGGASFTNKNTSNGLGGNTIYGVYASGSTVYAAAGGGLSISTDGGANFTNTTTTNGLGNNSVKGVYASGSTVYAATNGGLSISTDGGASFTNKTVLNSGLGNNYVRGVYASGSTVYAATEGGLSISTDGGASFTNKTTTNGLGSNRVNGVYVSGSTVYATTEGGLSISTDGGASFTNKTTSNGLGGNNVKGIYVSGNTVYAATSGGLSSCSAISCTPTTSTQTVSACGSYVWNGTTYTASNNTATYVTTNAGGCDSTVTLNLTINNATSSSETQSACGSYVWNGTTYTTSGAKIFTTTNAAGCDSVVTLNLTINNATTSSTTDTASGSYVWNGNTYTSSGTYTYQTTNAAGCDSTATLNLTINPAECTPTSSSDTIAACFSYTWNGVTYTTSGTRTWTGINASGCDSVVTLYLTISNNYPYSPFGVTQTVVSNVCSSRVYRYTASISPAGNTYNWILPNSIGGVPGVTVDSGNINSSRTILVRYVSNEAAFGTDSIKVRTFNGCSSVYKAVKLSNIKLSVPAAPSNITVTPVAPNVCSNRRYRFVAPALPAGTNSSTTTILPATGYLWTLVGSLSEFATIDSGDENSQKIVVSFSSNAAAVIGDSIKLQFLSSCGNSNAKALKLTNTKLSAPLAPTAITITAIQTNVCGARRYRYSAPNLPAATSANGAANGYLWSLVGTLSGSATIDSGTVNSQKITVTYTSNAAAATGDSIRLSYTSDCGNSPNKAMKLSNTKLGVPLAPSSITMQIKSDVCNARTYRYIAPAVLPSATSAVGAATGYLWSAPTGTVGSTGTIDSGDVNSRIITVTYSSNSAAGVGDSIRLRYTSGCGNGVVKAQRLSNLAKLGCAPINPIAKVSSNNEGSTLSVKVYPNPTKNQFSIQINSGVTDGVVIRVLDMQGRFVSSVKTTANQTISLGSQLKAGVYLLEVIQGKDVKTTRVVKF